MKLKIFKSLLIITFLSAEYNLLLSQQTNVTSKYDLYFASGIVYKIGDWTPGIELDGIIYSPGKRLSFGSRNLFLFRIEKIMIDSLSYSRNYVLSTYHTLNYLDLQFNFWQSKRHPSFVGVGVGWIYNGTKENFKQKSYGYGVLSLTFGYKITWFFVEIRGDIPLDLFSNDDLEAVKIFPITVGLNYRMKPKE